jgi:hypothetical protein
MKCIHYLPIYDWGEDPDAVNGNSHGCMLYSDLQMLYAYEEEAVGYFEVEVEIPTQNKFREQHGIKSGAV